jgi:hypothetical protein
MVAVAVGVRVTCCVASQECVGERQECRRLALYTDKTNEFKSSISMNKKMAYINKKLSLI